MAAAERDVVVDSPWAPLSQPLFRGLWIATIVSNIGSWMHEVGAGWVMATMAPSPLLVALVQTAASLPVFFLALPAGALSDIVDRRRYLLATQLFLVLVAAGLTAIVFLGVLTPLLLVIITFLMGIGTALGMPAWAALTPEIVDRRTLQPAIALNSMGMNVARAIGPALAGLLIARFGAVTVFALNAVSFLGVVIFLFRWQRSPRSSHLPAERFFSAVSAGIRYARHAPSLQTAVVRGIGFFLFASVTWALLPLIAKDLVGGGPEVYGVLVGAIGAGAVFGAVQLPRLRARFDRDQLVAGASIVYAGIIAAISVSQALALMVPVMAVSGIAWIVVLSNLQVSAQLALPDWVRARGLSVFMMAFMGAMALGSILWGQVAAMTSLQTALGIAAVGLAAFVPLTWRWRLARIEGVNLAPSMHWPVPLVRDDVTHDRGPVLVTIVYEIAEGSEQAFMQAMRSLRAERLRDGAYTWSVFQDTDSDTRFIETFEVGSWLEHLRQHDRVTESDRGVQEIIRGLLAPGTTTQVAHYVAPLRLTRTQNHKESTS